MKYCIYCGNKLDDDAIYCTKCGKKQNTNTNDKQKNDSVGLILGILSILFSYVPLVSLILGIIAIVKGSKNDSIIDSILGCIGVTLSVLTTLFYVYLLILYIICPSFLYTIFYIIVYHLGFIFFWM